MKNKLTLTLWAALAFPILVSCQKATETKDTVRVTVPAEEEEPLREEEAQANPPAPIPDSPTLAAPAAPPAPSEPSGTTTTTGTTRSTTTTSTTLPPGPGTTATVPPAVPPTTPPPSPTEVPPPPARPEDPDRQLGRTEP